MNMENKKVDDLVNPAAARPRAAEKGAVLLFVDDEPNILASLKRLFRPLGYRILTAESGHAGLKVLEQEPVDLIISDMRMPEMDGAAFLEQAAGKWPDTMRLLLTGYADMSAAIEAINKGKIFKYLSKPWDENDIKLTVERALHQRFLEQERKRLEALTWKQNEELKQLNNTLEERVRARTAELEQTVSFLELAQNTVKENFEISIGIISNLVGMRTGAKGRVAHQVAELAAKLAGRLKLESTEIQDITYAAQLHEIGKVGLSDNVIQSAYYSLRGAERVAFTRHPIIGEGLLMAMDALQDAARFIRYQYERYDGKGFPEGLSGEAIPLGSRILAVARDFVDLQRGFIVPERADIDKAKAFVVQNRGKRYDPRVVEAFVEEFNIDSGEQKRIRGGVPTKTGGLKPGMVLMRDLITEDGMLLLKKGHVLNEVLIRKIQNTESAIEADFTLYVQPKGG